MTFNPLEHPVCFSFPHRSVFSAWTQHVPVAMLMVDLLRPKLFVELGTHSGMSYCAFCQAVKDLGVDCRCFAVDNWIGDEHSGLYGSDILQDLRTHHDPRYQTFSTLIQSDFDEALDRFADGSIDLLHIDGYHTYDAVKHDFDLWHPKVSRQGVVLFHDIAEHGKDFGAWKFWREVTERYPHHIQFNHGHGLGVVCVGEIVPEGLLPLLELPSEHWPALREFFCDLGSHLEKRQELLMLLEDLQSPGVVEAQYRVGELFETEQRLTKQHEEDERLRADLTAQYADSTAQYEERIAAMKRELAERVEREQAERVEREQAERVEHENVSLVRHYEDLLDAARAQRLELERQLNWFESSRGVRVIKLARASRAVLQYKGPMALAKHGAQWLMGQRGYGLSDINFTGQANAHSPNGISTSAGGAAPVQSRPKTVMFYSGCPGDAMRYRAHHQAEQLEMLGCACEVGQYTKTDLQDMLERFHYFIFHRVPYGPDIEWFIDQAHKRGKPVIFDTDDLVFDPDAAKHVAALDDMKPLERNLYIEGLVRYQKTLLRCDAVLVSTESLREEALRLHEHVFVAPNVVSLEMLRGADTALAVTGGYGKTRQDDSVVIGYFSGTPTHSRDFAEAADAVLWALETYPHVKFMLIGHLQLDSRFDRFENRVERMPLQPWQHLPHLYTRVDINLAPLEPHNPFTDAKSCLKYMEAALLGVPTIASPRRDFLRVIRHGENALLAETPQEWREALGELIASAPRRREIGQRASEQVRAECTSPARALALSETINHILRTISPKRAERRLTINWILRAPIAERGGGYRTIFRLANYLGSQGHTVRVYVERIAHLERMTDNQIRAFVAKHFGPLHVEVVVGHDHIAPADASIATNWPTAFTVAKHAESAFKFYFVQDFEPEFYDRKDPLYREAERTYGLPLHQICIGPYLEQRLHALTGKPAEHIDFALDDQVFRLTRPQEQRDGPTTMLFFARPGLKRRGYEQGIEALKLVKQQRPDVEIRLFGSTDDELGTLPFEATNLGVLAPEELASELNRAHILLTFSLSNISWVPFEGMACGVAVVEADVPSVRAMVDAGETCLLAEVEPQAIAATVLRLVDDPALRAQLASNAVAAMRERTWEHTAAQFERLLARGCWAGEDGPGDALEDASPDVQDDTLRAVRETANDEVTTGARDADTVASVNGASMHTGKRTAH